MANNEIKGMVTVYVKKEDFLKKLINGQLKGSDVRMRLYLAYC